MIEIFSVEEPGLNLYSLRKGTVAFFLETISGNPRWVEAKPPQTPRGRVMFFLNSRREITLFAPDKFFNKNVWKINELVRGRYQVLLHSDLAIEADLIAGVQEEKYIVLIWTTGPGEELLIQVRQREKIFAKLLKKEN